MSKSEKEQVDHNLIEKEIEIQKEDRTWVVYAFGSCIGFTIANIIQSTLTQEVGMAVIFYYSPGYTLGGLCYHIICSIKNKEEKGIFWNNQNIINYGKLDMKNLVGYIGYCLMMAATMVCLQLNFYYANLAYINVGLVTVVWRASIFISAFLDYVIFGQKLKIYHYVGLVTIIICTSLISIDHLHSTQVLASPRVELWVPILFTVMAPLLLTLHAMLTKHLTQPRIGFDGMNLCFSSFAIVNFIFLIAGIPYWINNGVNWKLFGIGVAGSFISSVGTAVLSKGLQSGPVGPVLAIADAYPPLLVVFEAVKNGQMLSKLEIIGVIFGMYGALLMAVPNQFGCCFKKCSK